MRKELRFGSTLVALILLGIVVLMPAPADWTNGHLGLLMLSLVVVAIMLGFPTAFTLMGMGVLFAWLAYKDISGGSPFHQTLDLMVQRTYAVMTNDVLISVPLFVFMGYLVERASLVGELFRSLHLALARLPGALAIATLLTCALFATATGIVGAVVTLMALIALPTMLRAGYDARLATGCVAAGGCLGILIPPSVLLIVYGATAGVSVVQLYAGALLPGVLLAGLYVGYVLILAKLKPSLAPPLSSAERQISIPTGNRQVEAAFGSRAAQGLVRALFTNSRVGVSRGLVARELLVLLVPLLFVVALVCAYQYSVQAGAAGEDLSGAAAGGLQQLGSFSDLDASGRMDVGDSSGSSFNGFWAIAGALVAALTLFYVLVDFSRLQILKLLLKSFVPLAGLIVAVLGSIVLGLATPTEAAAIGSLGGVLLALAYRRLSWKVMKESVFLTSRTTSMVCWLFVGSSIFSAAFALLGGQALVEQWVLGLDLTPIQFLLLAQFIIFLLGWPLEWTEIIVIFMPIFVPLLGHFQIDPLFFGLLVAINLQTAFLSPPVAMAAFYIKGVAPPGVTLGQIFSGMLPFMGIQILMLGLLYAFPSIGMWLPTALYR